jgi:hypothetical protein
VPKSVILYVSILLLFFLSSSIRAQEKPIDIKIERDRFTNKTTISTEMMTVSGSMYDNFGIMFVLAYIGSDPTKSVILMGVEQIRKDRPLQSFSEVYFLADNQPVAIREFKKIDEGRVNASVFSHQYVSSFQYKDLLAIAKSTKVEMKIGRVETELINPQIDAIRRFIKYIDGTLTFTPLPNNAPAPSTETTRPCYQGGVKVSCP